MLVRVSLDEILSSPALPFNLYTGNGQLLYAMGIQFPRGEMKPLKTMALYRDFHHLPHESEFRHEGVSYPAMDTPLSDSEKQAVEEEEKIQPIYAQYTQQVLFQSTTDFWRKLNEGNTFDIALCELIRDTLVSEVTTKADQIHLLTQVAVRDSYTYSHILHVTAISIALAIKAGFSHKEIKDIALSAILHDLGKFLIPKDIMFKPTRLTEKEFSVMKLHPELGYRMIRQELHLPEHIALPALEHQEMNGGGGYPYNKKGNEIHPYSQVVKIADVYEALTAKRPYKDPVPAQKALHIMVSEGEKSFNPELLQLFSHLGGYQE